MKVILVLLLLLSEQCIAQQWSKVTTFGGKKTDAAYKVVHDKEGGIYIIGQYSSSITIDTITLVGSDQQNVYIAKYNRFNRVVWAQTYVAAVTGPANIADVYGLVAGPSGSIYICGSYIGHVMIDSIELPLKAPTGLYIAKISSNGIHQWLKTPRGYGQGTFNQNIAFAIALDSAEHCVVTGNYVDTVSFDTVTIASGHPRQTFLVQYDSSGNVLWARGSRGAGAIHAGLAVAVDRKGNTYLCGEFFYQIAFGSDTINANDAEQKIFLCKYDSAGRLLWSQKVGTGGYYGFVQDITVDSAGNPYLIGRFRSTIDFGAFQRTHNKSVGVSYATLIIKYNSDGAIQWATQTSGAEHSAGGYGIVVDDQQHCFVTGSFSGPTTFGDTILSMEKSNLYVAQLDDLGKFIWIKTVSGTGQSSGGPLTPMINGSLVVVGGFAGSVFFDDISITAESNDVFIATLSTKTDEVSENKHTEVVPFYPNPAHGIIHFTSIGTHRVTDLLGRTLKQTTQAQMNVNNLASGSYYIDGKLVIVKN